jgi:hypothetical protein
VTFWRRHRETLVGLLGVAISALIYWYTAHDFESPRDDFFLLADSLLKGHTWLPFRPGEHDVIIIGDHLYVPFGPFPAVLFMPFVALVGLDTANQYGAEVDVVLATICIGLCWALLGRLGVQRLVQRVWIVALFGFSTVFWWVTMRGGVWHTGQIVATLLTLGALVELFGERRPYIVGLLAGAAFLTRAPLALAIPFYVLLLWPAATDELVETARVGVRTLLARFPVAEAASFVLAVVPAVVFFFWYNDVRFGNPLESGYALAGVPAFLEERRELGLFSFAHLGMNLDLMFLRLPTPIPDYPFIKPDGFGMSVVFTSPALLLALRAPWRRPVSWWLAGAAIAVLIPTLLYYGGGWVTFGFRYFLDSIPFVIALCGLAVARRGLAWPWMVLIVFGILVGVASVHWVDKI